MTWGKARKKPIEVQFRVVQPKTHIRTLGLTKEEIWGEVLDTGHEGSIVFAYPDKDFIIKDEEGEYPIKKELFYKTYDVLQDPNQKETKQ